MPVMYNFLISKLLLSENRGYIQIKLYNKKCPLPQLNFFHLARSTRSGRRAVKQRPARETFFLSGRVQLEQSDINCFDHSLIKQRCLRLAEPEQTSFYAGNPVLLQLSRLFLHRTVHCMAFGNSIAITLRNIELHVNKKYSSFHSQDNSPGQICFVSWNKVTPPNQDIFFPFIPF